MMKHVNVYDWDKTIFPVDSTAAFCRWCVKRHPLVLFRFLPVLAVMPGYLLHLVSKTRMKEILYGFLRGIPDVDAEVQAFWDANFHRVNEWYLDQAHPDDIVISASPEFLISEPAKRLGVRLLASRVDRHTGKTTGENCHGEEKVARLREAHPDVKIAKFYSDSHVDDPLARLAEEAFLVRGSTLLPWNRKQ